VLASVELKCLPGVYHLLDLLDARAVATALVTNAPPSEMEFALGALQVWFYLPRGDQTCEVRGPSLRQPRDGMPAGRPAVGITDDAP
jgi:phosphoglycolate phosphatase-like HAD superfamily hydrolase